MLLMYNLLYAIDVFQLLKLRQMKGIGKTPHWAGHGTAQPVVDILQYV